MQEAITNLDFIILNWIQTNLHSSFADWFFPWFTALANGGFIWLLVTGVLLCRPKKRRQGFLLLCGLVLSFLIVNVILKPTVARPRPCWLVNFPLLISNPIDYSFPSGHTAASFISAFILMAKWKKAGAWALVGASLIAFSRLYLYVHYPSDVLASIFLAALISGGVLWGKAQMRKKQDKIWPAERNRK